MLYGTLLPYSFHVGIDTTFNMDASSGTWRTILHMVQPHAMRLGDLILYSSTLYLHNCGACISHPKPYWPLLYRIAGNFRLEKIFAFFAQARRGRKFFR